MFKIILLLYTITNLYDTMFIKNETPISDMKDFIENQQYREDQLRYHCNLGNYMIKPKPNIYESIYNDIKKFISINIQENIYPMLYDSPINSLTFDEFIMNSQDKSNINRKLIYREKTFLLKNNNLPLWELIIDDFIIGLFNIKLVVDMI